MDTESKTAETRVIKLCLRFTLEYLARALTEKEYPFEEMTPRALTIPELREAILANNYGQGLDFQRRIREHDYGWRSYEVRLDGELAAFVDVPPLNDVKYGYCD